MGGNRFERLTPRQRECLRLVRELQSTKQIAATLGIRPGTVNGYLDEAVAVLGASDRRSAALEFHAYEQSSPGKLGGESIRFEPNNPIGPRSEPGSDALTSAPNRVQETRVEFEVIPERQAIRPSPLPWSQGGNRNDLTLAQRGFWVIAIALAIIVAFGSFVAAFEAIGRIGWTALQR